MKKTKFAAAITAVVASLFVFSASAEEYSVSGTLGADSKDDTSATVTATVTNGYYYDVDDIGYSVSVSDNAVIKGESSKNDISLESGESDSLTFEVELTGANPGTGSDIGIAAIALSGAALLVIGVVTTKKKKQLLSLFLCATVAGTAALSSLQLTADAEEVADNTASQKLELELGGEKVTITLDIDLPEQPEVHDNSEEDIGRLNGGKATISRYADSGKVSFINGRYTDYKVTDPETAFNSIGAVDTLLNSKM